MRRHAGLPRRGGRAGLLSPAGKTALLRSGELLLLQVPLLYLYSLAGGAAALFLLTLTLISCRLHRGCRAKQPEPPVKRISNGTVETMLNHKVQ